MGVNKIQRSRATYGVFFLGEIKVTQNEISTAVDLLKGTYLTSNPSKTTIQVVRISHGEIQATYGVFLLGESGLTQN